jgi:hypothetical protein
MRFLPGLACALSLLGCSQSKKPATERSDPYYVCAVHGEGLVNQAWNTPPKGTRTSRNARTSVPRDFPFTVDSPVRILWSLPLGEGARALFFGAERDPRSAERDPRALDGEYFFASLDPRDEVVVSPVRIDLWNGDTSMVWPEHFATSESEQIAAAAVLTRDGESVNSVVLLAADGSEVGHALLPTGSKIHTLENTPSGDFVMVMSSRSVSTPNNETGTHPFMTQLTFSRLSAEGKFEAHAEPFALASGVGDETTRLLIPLADGFIAAWDEVSGIPARGSRVSFQRLNSDGSAVGEPLALLPATDAPYQDQLSGAFNGRQLGLLWVEDTEPPYTIDPGPEATELPRHDPSYYFMLISAHDLSPRSNVLEIERAKGLDEPKLIVEDGQFRVHAHAGRAGWIGATLPISVDCEPE